jgi:ActR/RegA family two-component response regulator
VIMICTADAEFAQTLHRAVEGTKCYCLRAETPTGLRQAIHEQQPAVVILDVTMGGQRFRAIDCLWRIETVRSRPHIILVTPWESKAVEDEAARFGCYEVLSADGEAFLGDVAETVKDALWDRRGRAHGAPRSGSGPGSVH